MKYKIEKNTVQETLIIPLYGRKIAMECYPNLFDDHDAIKLCESIDYTYNGKVGIKEKIGGLMGAGRQYDMARACEKYLKDHPFASVVNLGCGLDTTFYQIDNGEAISYCIDMPDVIELRKQLLPEREREKYISCDLNDYSWMDEVDFEIDKGIVLFASGVFYYFQKEDVKKLFIKMSEKFPGGLLAFDATNKKGIGGMQKTWIKDADIEIGTYFYLEDAEKELRSWSNNFKKITKKGYMSAYRPLLKDYGLIANIIFKYFEKSNSGQFIEIEF